MGRYIRCPRCPSKNLFIIEDNRNDFNAGVTGFLLTKSILGASIFANNVKSVFQCADCGKVYKKVW